MYPHSKKSNLCLHSAFSQVELLSFSVSFIIFYCYGFTTSYFLRWSIKLYIIHHALYITVYIIHTSIMCIVCSLYILLALHCTLYTLVSQKTRGKSTHMHIHTHRHPLDSLSLSSLSLYYLNHEPPTFIHRSILSPLILSRTLLIYAISIHFKHDVPFYIIQNIKYSLSKTHVPITLKIILSLTINSFIHIQIY